MILFLWEKCSAHNISMLITFNMWSSLIGTKINQRDRSSSVCTVMVTWFDIILDNFTEAVQTVKLWLNWAEPLATLTTFLFLKMISSLAGSFIYLFFQTWLGARRKILHQMSDRLTPLGIIGAQLRSPLSTFYCCKMFRRACNIITPNIKRVLLLFCVAVNFAQEILRLIICAYENFRSSYSVFGTFWFHICIITIFHIYIISVSDITVVYYDI